MEVDQPPRRYGEGLAGFVSTFSAVLPLCYVGLSARFISLCSSRDDKYLPVRTPGCYVLCIIPLAGIKCCH